MVRPVSSVRPPSVTTRLISYLKNCKCKMNYFRKKILVRTLLPIILIINNIYYVIILFLYRKLLFFNGCSGSS